MTPFPPVLARYERFIYTKRKLLCIRKQQGLEFKLEKKNLLLHKICICGALKGKWGG